WCPFGKPAFYWSRRSSLRVLPSALMLCANARGTVDRLPNHICMTKVASGFFDHMKKHPLQAHCPEVGAVNHGSVIKRKFAGDLIGPCPCGAVLICEYAQ